MIGAREYRFLSPSLCVEKGTGRVVKPKGAGLVHNPALHITALASEGRQHMHGICERGQETSTA